MLVGKSHTPERLGNAGGALLQDPPHPTKVQRQAPRLTRKQAEFASLYARTGKGADSARRAGYSERCAAQIAFKLLQRPRIQAAVERARAPLVEPDEIVIDRLEDVVIEGRRFRIIGAPVLATRKRNVLVVCHPAPGPERRAEIEGALAPFEPMSGEPDLPGLWFCKTSADFLDVRGAVVGSIPLGPEAWAVILADDFVLAGFDGGLHDRIVDRRVYLERVGGIEFHCDPEGRGLFAANDDEGRPPPPEAAGSAEGGKQQ